MVLIDRFSLLIVVYKAKTDVKQRKEKNCLTERIEYRNTLVYVVCLVPQKIAVILSLTTYESIAAWMHAQTRRAKRRESERDTERKKMQFYCLREKEAIKKRGERTTRRQRTMHPIILNQLRCQSKDWKVEIARQVFSFANVSLF